MQVFPSTITKCEWIRLGIIKASKAYKRAFKLKKVK